MQIKVLYSTNFIDFSKNRLQNLLYETIAFIFTAVLYISYQERLREMAQ
jgi:hypothetical protein